MDDEGVGEDWKVEACVPGGGGMSCWRYKRSPTVMVWKRGHSGTWGWLAAEGAGDEEAVDADTG